MNIYSKIINHINTKKQNEPRVLIFNKYIQIEEVLKKIPTKGIDRFYEGKKPYTGLLEVYGEDDSLELRAEMKNGYRYNKWTRYYSNGNYYIIENYKRGLRNGKYEMFYENGVLKLEGDMIHERESGLWKWYRENGTLEAEVYYEDGEQVGVYTLYYENGNVGVQTKPLLSDKRKRYIKYDIDGNVILECYTHDGVKQGEFIRYDSSGVIRETGNYKNGAYQGEIKYYSYDGKLYKTEMYESGILKDNNNTNIKVKLNRVKISEFDEKTLDNFKNIKPYLEKIKLGYSVHKLELEDVLKSIPRKERKQLYTKIIEYIGLNNIIEIKFSDGLILNNEKVIKFFKDKL